MPLGSNASACVPGTSPRLTARTPAQAMTASAQETDRLAHGRGSSVGKMWWVLSQRVGAAGRMDQQGAARGEDGDEVGDDGARDGAQALRASHRRRW